MFVQAVLGFRGLDLSEIYLHALFRHILNLRSRLRLKCDDTRAENRFRLSAKQTSPFESAVGVSSVDYWQPKCAHQR